MELLDYDHHPAPGGRRLQGARFGLEFLLLKAVSAAPDHSKIPRFPSLRFSEMRAGAFCSYPDRLIRDCPLRNGAVVCQVHLKRYGNVT